MNNYCILTQLLSIENSTAESPSRDILSTGISDLATKKGMSACVHPVLLDVSHGRKSARVRSSAFDMYSSSSRAYSTDTPNEILAGIQQHKGVTFPDVKSERKKAKRCGECRNCTTNDCGTCVYCSDMKKYWGPGKKKKNCVLRKCLTQIQPHVPSRTKPNYPLTIKDTPDVVDQENAGKHTCC